MPLNQNSHALLHRTRPRSVLYEFAHSIGVRLGFASEPRITTYLREHRRECITTHEMGSSALLMGKDGVTRRVILKDGKVVEIDHWPTKRRELR